MDRRWLHRPIPHLHHRNIQGENLDHGRILCTEKSDTVSRDPVLNDRNQIFASKYLASLPSEEQLQRENERTHRLIEAALEEREKIGGVQ